MKHYLTALFLLLITQVTGVYKDTNDLVHSVTINAEVRDLSIDRLARRGSEKRLAASIASSKGQDQDQPPRLTQSPNRHSATSSTGRSIVQQRFNLCRETRRMQSACWPFSRSQAQDSTGLQRLSETDRRQKSPSKEKSQSSFSDQSRRANNYGLASSFRQSRDASEVARSPNPGSNQHQSSKASESLSQGLIQHPSSGRGINDSHDSSTTSQGGSATYSSDASSTRKKHPASIGTSTMGPATVQTWLGRTRMRGQGPIQVKGGETLSLTSTDPKRVVVHINHHDNTAETRVIAQGQIAGTATSIVRPSYQGPEDGVIRTISSGNLSGWGSITAEAKNSRHRPR